MIHKNHFFALRGNMRHFLFLDDIGLFHTPICRKIDH